MDNTEIVVILDRSGSMQVARSDHEGGLNSFVEDQKGLAGDVRFTLVQFDSQNPCEIIYDGVPITEVGKCELIPRGGTPLLDAIGRAVAHVTKRQNERETKPDHTVVMVITDGQENCSREFTKGAIRSLVTEKEQGAWKFLFLGANIDSFSEGGALGVASASTMSFANNSVGVQSMYSSVSHKTLQARCQSVGYRSEGDSLPKSVLDTAYAFDASERAQAMGETPDSDPQTVTAANLMNSLNTQVRTLNAKKGK